jgi:hypothetical protein
VSASVQFARSASSASHVGPFCSIAPVSDTLMPRLSKNFLPNEFVAAGPLKATWM